jgi:tetrahydromethanopterin S-methyltransferase subunit A
LSLLIKKLEDGVGMLCKVLLPVKQEYHLGAGKVSAICTLSSFELLDMISRSFVMSKVLIAGRLLSENKGIDAIIAFTISHPELRRIILCGNEVRGHRAGQALLALLHNGVEPSGRIIGATGANPFVTQSQDDVEIFRRQVQIIDLIGIVNIDIIGQFLIS